MCKNFKCAKKLNGCVKFCDKVFASDLHVVSLYGRGEKGKTQTLNKLLTLLTQPNFVFKTANGFNSYANFLNSVQNNPKQDHTALFTYTNKKGENKTVGITTTGDMCYCLAKEFDWLKQANNNQDCNLYICASHLNGSTVDWLKARTANGYLLRLSKLAIETIGNVPNVPIISQNTINDLQAKYIYDIILNLL